MKAFKFVCLSTALVLTATFADSSFVRADVLEPSASQLFGVSAAYNNVIFGDYYARSGDTEGHIAIQGNVDVQKHAFGAGEQVMHQDGPVLVVGGNVVASSSDVYDGDAYIGGKLTSAVGSQWNALGVKGSGPDAYNLHDPNYEGTTGTIYVADTSNFIQWGPDYHQELTTSLPFDFTVAQEQLRTVSTELFAMNETVTGSFAANTGSHDVYNIDLTGMSGIQVLTMDAATFNAIDSLYITAEADTTLILNILADGTDTLDFTKWTMYINGDANEFVGDFDGSNILLNTDVENIVVSSAKVNMSILGLDAHFDIQHGHITGQAFGESASLTNGGEFHAYYTFDDQHFGTPAATPEPGTMLIFGLGLAGLGLGSRRFRCKNS